MDVRVWLVTFAVGLALGACRGQAPADGTRSEVYHLAAQRLFVLDTRNGRVDAYSLRGGVSWLGGIRLPGGNGTGWQLAAADWEGRLLLHAGETRYVLEESRFLSGRLEPLVPPQVAVGEAREAGASVSR